MLSLNVNLPIFSTLTDPLIPSAVNGAIEAILMAKKQPIPLAIITREFWFIRLMFTGHPVSLVTGQLCAISFSFVVHT